METCIHLKTEEKEYLKIIIHFYEEKQFYTEIEDKVIQSIKGQIFRK